LETDQIREAAEAAAKASLESLTSEALQELLQLPLPSDTESRDVAVLRASEADGASVGSVSQDGNGPDELSNSAAVLLARELREAMSSVEEALSAHTNRLAHVTEAVFVSALTKLGDSLERTPSHDKMRHSLWQLETAEDILIYAFRPFNDSLSLPQGPRFALPQGAVAAAEQLEQFEAQDPLDVSALETRKKALEVCKGAFCTREARSDARKMYAWADSLRELLQKWSPLMLRMVLHTKVDQEHRARITSWKEYCETKGGSGAIKDQILNIKSQVNANRSELYASWARETEEIETELILQGDVSSALFGLELRSALLYWMGRFSDTE